jgi:hypothetical protein
MFVVLNPNSFTWPSGDSKPIMVIRSKKQDLIERFGLCFDEFEDDLDRFIAAAIEIEGTGKFLFRQYLHDNQGVFIECDRLLHTNSAIEKVIQELDFVSDEIEWLQSEI